eukprot:7357266-Prymnesium_polylepis.1
MLTSQTQFSRWGRCACGRGAPGERLRPIVRRAPFQTVIGYDVSATALSHGNRTRDTRDARSNQTKGWALLQLVRRCAGRPGPGWAGRRTESDKTLDPPAWACGRVGRGPGRARARAPTGTTAGLTI